MFLSCQCGYIFYMLGYGLTGLPFVSTLFTSNPAVDSLKSVPKNALPGRDTTIFPKGRKLLPFRLCRIREQTNTSWWGGPCPRTTERIRLRPNSNAKVGTSKVSLGLTWYSNWFYNVMCVHNKYGGFQQQRQHQKEPCALGDDAKKRREKEYRIWDSQRQKPTIKFY